VCDQKEVSRVSIVHVQKLMVSMINIEVRVCVRVYWARPEINGGYDQRRGACVCVTAKEYRACLLCTSRN